MRVFRVVVPVPDIAAASRFYAAVLAQEGRRVSPGRHYFDVGRSILALYDPVADGVGGRAAPLPEPLYLGVHALESFHERAAAAGAVFDTSSGGDGGPQGRITDRPSGERSFYCKDPFGNPLAFVEAGTEFTGL